MSEKTSEPHVLVIEGYHDDQRDPDEVRHPESCPTETRDAFDFDGDERSYEVYTCMVEYWLEQGSLDDLTEHGDKRLEPGEYKIEGWSAHYLSTPMTPEEWDGGLRFLEEPE